MHTSLAPRVRATRHRQPPSVGARAAGHRNASGACPIYWNDGTTGQLADVAWFRVYGTRAAPWGISSLIGGDYVYRAAVIDDFGNLVAVPA